MPRTATNPPRTQQPLQRHCSREEIVKACRRGSWIKHKFASIRNLLDGDEFMANSNNAFEGITTAAADSNDLFAAAALERAMDQHSVFSDATGSTFPETHSIGKEFEKQVLPQVDTSSKSPKSLGVSEALSTTRQASLTPKNRKKPTTTQRKTAEQLFSASDSFNSDQAMQDDSDQSTGNSLFGSEHTSSSLNVQVKKEDVVDFYKDDFTATFIDNSAEFSPVRRVEAGPKTEGEKLSSNAGKKMASGASSVKADTVSTVSTTSHSEEQLATLSPVSPFVSKRSKQQFQPKTVPTKRKDVVLPDSPFSVRSTTAMSSFSIAAVAQAAAKKEAAERSGCSPSKVTKKKALSSLPLAPPVYSPSKSAQPLGVTITPLSVPYLDGKSSKKKSVNRTISPARSTVSTKSATETRSRSPPRTQMTISPRRKPRVRSPPPTVDSKAPLVASKYVAAKNSPASSARKPASKSPHLKRRGSSDFDPKSSSLSSQLQGKLPGNEMGRRNSCGCTVQSSPTTRTTAESIQVLSALAAELKQRGITSPVKNSKATPLTSLLVDRVKDLQEAKKLQLNQEMLKSGHYSTGSVPKSHYSSRRASMGSLGNTHEEEATAVGTKRDRRQRRASVSTPSPIMHSKSPTTANRPHRSGNKELPTNVSPKHRRLERAGRSPGRRRKHHGHSGKSPSKRSSRDTKGSVATPSDERILKVLAKMIEEELTAEDLAIATEQEKSTARVRSHVS